MAGIKKSKFLGQSQVPAGATLDYVSGGTNYKIDYSDFLQGLGVSGEIVQVGDPLQVPILDDQGAIKGIRNIRGANGVTVSIDPDNSIKISADSAVIGGIDWVVDKTYGSADIVRSGARYYISLVGNNLGNAPASNPSDWQDLAWQDQRPAYNTNAEMVADVSLSLGQSVERIGYYAAGDGGGAKYIIVAGGTGTDDGGSYIDLDNGLQAQLIASGAINFKVFGVRSGVDSTAEAQAAADFGSIIVPGEAFIVSSLKLSKGRSVFGYGKASELIQKAGSVGPLITTKNPLIDINISIYNLTINGNKSAQASDNAGIDLDNTGISSGTLVENKIDKLWIRNTKGDGIVHSFPGRGSVYRDIVTYNVDGNGVNIKGSDSSFSDIDCGQSGLSGFRFSGGAANQLVNCKAWFSGRIDNSLGHGYYIRSSNANKLSNCYSQENKANGFYLHGASSSVNDTALYGCTAETDNSADVSASGFNLENAHNCTLDVRAENGTNAAFTMESGVYMDNCTGITCNADVVDPTINGVFLAGVTGSDITVIMKDNKTDPLPATDGVLVTTGTADCVIRARATGLAGNINYQIDGSAADIANNSIEIIGRSGKVFNKVFASTYGVNAFNSEVTATTLTNGITVSDVTGRFYTGLKLKFIFTQDGIGGHSVTFSSDFLVTSGALDTAPNSVTVYEFISSGTIAGGNLKWVESGFTTGAV